MKNTLIGVAAGMLAFMLLITGIPGDGLAAIVSGSQTDTSASFSLRWVSAYTKTLHATFVYTDDAEQTHTVAEQYVLAGGVLSEPATPSRENNRFVGWAPSISGAPAPGETVSADFLAGAASDPVHVTYTARFAPVYYVFFHDVSGQNQRVIMTKEWSVGDDAVSTQDVYPSAGPEQQFKGWFCDEGLTVPAPDSFSELTGNVHLYSKVEDGHWLTFVTADHATGYAAAFYHSDEKTVDPGVPTRVGYTFEGWYTGENGTGEKFEFGSVLEKNMTLYASFREVTEAPYTVIFWKQKVTDHKDWGDAGKNYDYFKSETRMGRVGAPVSPSDEDRISPEAGFAYNDNNSAAVTVKSDGSSVLNVYYDRQLITFTFYRQIGATGKEYPGATAPAGYDFKATLASNQLYFSAMYSISGLHGQSMSMYGDQWPAGKWYQVTSTKTEQWGIYTTFLDAFLYTTWNSQTGRYAQFEESGGGVLKFFKQNLDGSYTDPAMTIADYSATRVFTLTNKYNGFTLHHYDVTYTDGTQESKENTQRLTLGNKEAGIFIKKLDVYYSRNTYTIDYKQGNNAYYEGNSTAAASASRLYEEPLSGAENAAAIRPDGIPDYYVTDGVWYGDPDCTKPYDFSGIMADANVVVYARWYAPEYDVTVNIAYEDGVHTSVIRVPAGQLAQLSIPTREGYGFAGWMEITNGSRAPFNDGTPILHDTTVEAIWVPHGWYTVSYVGGSDPENDRTDHKVYTANVEADVMYPASQSHEVDGTRVYFHSWNTKADGSGDTYFPNSALTVTGDMILYARYVEKEDTVTLVYDPNGGENGKTVEGILPNQPTELYMGATYAGHTLLGWATSADVESPEFTGGEITLDGETPVEILYAVWSPDEREYTVNHYLRGTQIKVADTYTGMAGVGVSVSANQASLYNEYSTAEISPDSLGQSIVMQADGNVINVYYVIPVVVKADNKTKVYGTENPELTATVEGLLEEDRIVYSLSCEATSNSGAGIHEIIASGDREQGYYTVRYENGELSIVKAPADQAVIIVPGKRTAQKSMGTGIINLNVGDCCE